MIHPAPTPPERFAALLQMLQRAVAACWKDGLLTPAMILLIWHRLHRIGRSFARLAARIAAGTYKPRKAYRRRPSERPKPRQESPFPTGFGWLVPLVPWQPERREWGAACAGNLRHLLTNDPEMRQLLAAAPKEMGRILRPLCRMLGVKPPDILARQRPPSLAAPPEPPSEPPARPRSADQPAARPAPPPRIGPPPRRQRPVRRSPRIA